MNLLHIKNISEIKGISIKSVAEKINMSEQNLHRCIRVNQIQAHQLEIIARMLEVPVGYFFDETPGSSSTNKITQKGDNSVMIGNNNGTISKLENCTKEVEHLKELLAEKERQIVEKDNRLADKDMIIELLKNK